MGRSLSRVEKTNGGGRRRGNEVGHPTTTTTSNPIAPWFRRISRQMLHGARSIRNLYQPVTNREIHKNPINDAAGVSMIYRLRPSTGERLFSSFVLWLRGEPVLGNWIEFRLTPEGRFFERLIVPGWCHSCDGLLLKFPSVRTDFQY